LKEIVPPSNLRPEIHSGGAPIGEKVQPKKVRPGPYKEMGWSEREPIGEVSWGGFLSGQVEKQNGLFSETPAEGEKSAATSHRANRNSYRKPGLCRKERNYLRNKALLAGGEQGQAALIGGRDGRKRRWGVGFGQAGVGLLSQ